MGIGGCVTIQSSTVWFSETWTRPSAVHTSWEALAQLCIILIVHEKCEPCLRVVNIQSASGNTGAEANINHRFSTTEVLSDIIKLVSMTQLPCNTLQQNVHHIPGEKNTDADNLSRGKTSSFSHKWKISFNPSTIFDTTPFRRYINSSDQWDCDIHPGAKDFFLSLLSLLSVHHPLFLLFSHVGCLKTVRSSRGPFTQAQWALLRLKRFLKGETPSIPLPPGIDDDVVSNPSTTSWLLISQSSTSAIQPSRFDKRSRVSNSIPAL